MPPTIDILPEELELSSRIGKQVARTWKAVESDDLTGYLNLWLVQNHSILIRYRGEDGGKNKLALSMHRAANKYCLKEQKIANGGVLTDNLHYTVEQVRAMLPYIWELDSWTQNSVSDWAGTKIGNTAPAAFDNALAMLSDVSGAFYGLNKRNQLILTLRFKESKNYKDIAKALAIDEPGAKSAVHRAVSRLLDSLGGVSADLNQK